MAAQTIKLWLFALPPSRFRRVAFLDLDLLITRNIDELLARSDATLAAVPAPNCKPHGLPVFNSGVLVFSPSLRTLRSLLIRLRFSMAPWHGALPASEERRQNTTPGASSWPSWVDMCAPVSVLFGGDLSASASGGCLLPNCLRAARLFPNSSQPFSACRRRFGGLLAPTRRKRAFADAVCEPKMTDQSILNWHAWCYGTLRWKPCTPDAHMTHSAAVDLLPMAYNTKWDGKAHAPTLKVCTARWPERQSAWRRQLAALPAVLHFHGPRKPWASEVRHAYPVGKVWSRWCDAADSCVPSVL